MATRTVTAMFDDYSAAAKAVSRLKEAGIRNDDISIVSNDAAERSRYDTDRTTDNDHDDAGKGAGTGATIGTLLGGSAGLLTGLGILAIPGLGPVVAAGWLAATLVGAGVGAATGGLIGGLAGAGIDERDAHVYAEGVRRGGSLVTVRADEMNSARVEDILDDEGTIDMVDREESWRKEGWTGQYAEEGSSTRGGTATSGTATGGTTTGGTTIGGTAMGGTVLDPRPLTEDERRRRVRTYPSV